MMMMMEEGEEEESPLDSVLRVGMRGVVAAMHALAMYPSSQKENTRIRGVANISCLAGMLLTQLGNDLIYRSSSSSSIPLALRYQSNPVHTSELLSVKSSRRRLPPPLSSSSSVELSAYECVALVKGVSPLSNAITTTTTRKKKTSSSSTQSTHLYSLGSPLLPSILVDMMEEDEAAVSPPSASSPPPTTSVSGGKRHREEETEASTSSVTPHIPLNDILRPSSAMDSVQEEEDV